MSIRITAIRLSGGTQHEHITRLWWTDLDNGQTGDNSRAELVDWIENKGGTAFVDDGYGHRVSVLVVTPSSGPKYLRTYADGRWTNNLLSLPQR